jgi:hypothetical protein
MTFIGRTFLASALIGRALLALAIFASTAVAMLASVCQAQAAFRQLPNGRIAIDLGANFTPSDRFSGFVDSATKASFAVIELPADAYERLKTIPDSQEALANEGFTGIQKAELKGREGDFIYLVGRQNTPAGEVTKFVLMFTQSDVTGLIVANVPQAAIDGGAYSRDGVEAILATVAVRDKPANPNEMFRLSHLGPFREAFDDGGLTKAYNISGAQPSSGGNRMVKEPMLLVSASIHGDAIDLRAQANKAFTELGGMTERRIEDQREVTIAGLRGYQILGRATDVASGSQLALRLVVLSGEPFGYFMFLGSMPAAESEKMMPEVEKMIASFELAK